MLIVGYMLCKDTFILSIALLFFILVYRLLLFATADVLEGLAVGTLVHSGVNLMGTNADTVERAEILR